MARVTVEDCLDKVENRFELVILAAKRARQLARGRVDAQVDWDDDKATVVALREIAGGKVNREIIDKAEAQPNSYTVTESIQDEGEQQPSS